MFFYEGDKFSQENYYSAYYEQNFSFPMHFHRPYELIYVTEGNLTVTINDCTYSLHSGEAAMVFPNQLHSFVSADSTGLIFILFTPDLIGHFSTQYQNMLPQNPVIQIVMPSVENLQFNNVYHKKAFLYDICATMTDYTDFSPVPQSVSELSPLHQILLYIEKHYQDDCSLSLIAPYLGYDYAYLSRVFKAKIKISFTDYLNQYRINQACRLLSHSPDSIATIALQCGYDTIRSFNRNFLKMSGVTPRSYREMH